MTAPSRSTYTYAYCLVEADGPPDLAGAPAGLEGASAPRALPLAERRWLIVADVPRATYDSEALDAGLQDLEWVGRCAMGHEEVVEHFLAAGTVIPMRLFTIFVDDARARAHIAARGDQITAVLERVRGHDEWGVRVLLDPERATRLARERAGGGEGPARSGKAFLMRKKRQQDAARDAVERARAEAERAIRTLAALASEIRERDESPDGLPTRALVDAAFLVPREREEGFHEAAERAAETLEACGCTFSLTGSWPPYNFLT